MAFNVTSLTNYTKTNEQMLLVKSFFEPKTATYMQKLTGVKSAIQVPQLSDTLIWQSGGNCGLVNASGDTTITARVLTVGRIKAEKSWCIADLETKYTQLLLAPGSQYEALPGGIDQAFMEHIMGQQGEYVEKGIWRADTTRWQDYLNKYDGLVKIINAASGTTQANAAAYGSTVTSITAANVISVLQMVYAAIPTSLLDKDDLRIFVSSNVNRLYQTALINANLYNFIPQPDALGEFFLHGTNVKVVPVPGLNTIDSSDSEAIYALRTSNLFLGVDLENEEEELNVWYSQDYDSVYMRMKFKLGTQIGIPQDVVKFTL
jgi:hypothetical protein